MACTMGWDNIHFVRDCHGHSMREIGLGGEAPLGNHHENVVEKFGSRWPRRTTKS
jgi:hypothetical protein